MLVDAKKVKQLRLEKNWTQQHLAEVCDLSLRTIQRVEKEGVASNETVGAYAAVFEMHSSDIILSSDEFEQINRNASISNRSNGFLGALLFVFFVVGLAAGIGLTLLVF